MNYSVKKEKLKPHTDNLKLVDNAIKLIVNSSTYLPDWLPAFHQDPGYPPADRRSSLPMHGRGLEPAALSMAGCRRMAGSCQTYSQVRPAILGSMYTAARHPPATAGHVQHIQQYSRLH